MFSVIIPNYNHAKFLPKRISTILDQSFTEFEIIILDDKSSDNSLEILDLIKDPRIKHRVYNSENSGSPFKQWKKGLELAKYDYVWIAETDDFSELTFLEEAQNILNNQEDISLLYFDSFLIGENEEPYYTTLQKVCAQLHPTLWLNNHTVNGKEYVKKYLSKKNTIINVSSVIFKKKYALKAIDKVLNFKTSGDWLFYILILQEGNVHFSNKKLNYFRHHQQTTRNYNTLEKRERRLLEKSKIKSSLAEICNLSKSEKLKYREELINEWITIHSFKEIFGSTYNKISETDLTKINSFTLITKSIYKKLHLTIHLSNLNLIH